MIRLGLTGGIGSGKSLVAEVLRRIGVAVFQADLVAREVLEKRSTLDQLEHLFGNRVLDLSGSVDRKSLASIVFSDTEKLNTLNGLIHPIVKSAFDDWCIHHASEPYVVHEAAILFESGFNKYFDKVATVYAPREVCIQRVVVRDKTDADSIIQRMNHQWTPERIASLSDYVIRNDGTLLLLPQIIELHKVITALAVT